MAERHAAFDREAMRRWLANWRAVNDAQDELARSEPVPSPARCLELGLSLISFALRVREREPGVELDRRHNAEDEQVRRTWRQIRVAHGR